MRVNYLQQGGMMPEDPYMDEGMDPGMEQEMDPGMDPGMEQEAGGSPEEQLFMMAQEIIQQVGPEAAMMLAEAIAMIVQEGGGGQPMPQEEPMYARRGGRLQRIR